jgi:hypothetical protein
MATDEAEVEASCVKLQMPILIDGEGYAPY